MLAPFSAFLLDQKYSILSPESIIVLIGFMLMSFVLFYKADEKEYLRRCLTYSIIYMIFVSSAFKFPAALEALLVFCFLWIVRSHLTTIVATIYITVSVSGALLSVVPQLSQSPKNTEPVNENLPNIIHLYIDEHIGPEGVSTSVIGGKALANDIKKMYLNNGFQLYGNAHSNYFMSTLSSSSFFNFDSSPDFVVANVEEINTNGKLQFRLKNNAYFQKMEDRGYRTNIYNSDYLSYCRQSSDICQQYLIDGLNEETLSAIPIIERSNILRTRFFMHKFFFRIAQITYSSIAQLNRHYVSNTGYHPIGAMSAFSMLDKIADDVKASPGGNLFFAHLLYAHHPHIWDSSCTLKEVKDWTIPSDFRTGAEKQSWTTGQEMYETLQTNYYEQLGCALKMTDIFFDKLRANNSFDNSIIIIHGDHGSRISRVRSIQHPGYPKMDAADLRNNYSTLYAIKRPGQTGSYNKSVRSIASLLADFAGIKSDEALKSDGIIYVGSAEGDRRTGRSTNWQKMKIPMPASGEADRQKPHEAH